MGSGGGRHPQGLKQRTLRTLFLRAPYVEWSPLMHGAKQEFRTPSMGAVSGVMDTPTPVVLYAVSPSLGQRRDGLMILTSHHRERLQDIREDPEALRREGCTSYDDFREYWRERTHRPYRALQHVEVFRLEPWGKMYPDRIAYELGLKLLERLYGEYIERS